MTGPVIEHVGTIDDILKHAIHVEQYEGLSANEQRIVALAKEVKRLRAEINRAALVARVKAAVK